MTPITDTIISVTPERTSGVQSVLGGRPIKRDWISAPYRGTGHAFPVWIAGMTEGNIITENHLGQLFSIENNCLKRHFAILDKISKKLKPSACEYVVKIF